MSENIALEPSSHLERVVDIISAYVLHNSVPAADLPGMIQAVHAALRNLANGKGAAVPEEKKDPAVPIKKSVTPEFIICLEDGKKFRSLKRHLRTAYSMTPDEYRTKWGLPYDYPMVAPEYAERRSKLALSMGLGKQAAKSRKPRGKK